MTALLDRLLAAIPDEPERFAALCDDIPDWANLIERAAREGVLGILLREMDRQRVEAPASARRLMDRLRAPEVLWQACATQALDAALRALGARGIRAAALKGPVLAERLYPDPTVRCSMDLDILVADRDTERATEVLEALGYALERGPSVTYARRHHHHVHLLARRGPMIELHFRTYAGFGVTIPAEELLDRARPYLTAGGAPCLVLEPEDEALYLAVHAAGHCFDRLLWLYDLKLLHARERRLDWDAVAVRARALGVMAALAIACDLLQRRLGVAVPAEAYGGAPARLGRRIVARFVDGRIAPPRSGPLVTLRHLLVMAALCDRPGAAATFLGHHLGRIARRRARRWLPAMTSVDWAA